MACQVSPDDVVLPHYSCLTLSCLFALVPLYLLFMPFPLFLVFPLLPFFPPHLLLCAKAVLASIYSHQRLLEIRTGVSDFPRPLPTCDQRKKSSWGLWITTPPPPASGQRSQSLKSYAYYGKFRCRSYPLDNCQTFSTMFLVQSFHFSFILRSAIESFDTMLIVDSSVETM